MLEEAVCWSDGDEFLSTVSEDLTTMSDNALYTHGTPWYLPHCSPARSACSLCCSPPCCDSARHRELERGNGPGARHGSSHATRMCHGAGLYHQRDAIYRQHVPVDGFVTGFNAQQEADPSVASQATPSSHHGNSPGHAAAGPDTLDVQQGAVSQGMALSHRSDCPSGAFRSLCHHCGFRVCRCQSKDSGALRPSSGALRPSCQFQQRCAHICMCLSAALTTPPRMCSSALTTGHIHLRS